MQDFAAHHGPLKPGHVEIILKISDRKLPKKISTWVVFTFYGSPRGVELLTVVRQVSDITTPFGLRRSGAQRCEGLPQVLKGHDTLRHFSSTECQPNKTSPNAIFAFKEA